MSTDNVRVRFAPSPTGFLHIGGARTALFNWLFARHNNGEFILRVEDTDRSRSTDEYIEAILDGMAWLGLDSDEGPYRQTERMDIYNSYIEQMLDEGNAYYCYCSQEELEDRRKKAMKEGRPVKYDGRCKELTAPPSGVNPSVRAQMPQIGQTVVDDMVRGKVLFDNEQLDDFIVRRSDGTPTYNFVVVVDDVDMKITHVIRGDDHLNNTPRQIHIYRALNFPVPHFAHLPMILGSDKARLSKRHGATSVQAYRDMGYLPEALINYLVRLGWSYGDQEIFSMEELIEKFTLQSVGKAAAVFNPEKFLWLNGQYIKETESERLVELALPMLIKEGLLADKDSLDHKWLAKAIDTLKERSKTLDELVQSLRYYISEDIEFDEKAKGKFLNEKSLPYLNELKEAISSSEDFSEPALEKIFASVIEKHGIKLRNLAQPVRVALTGGTKSPGIYEVLDIIGKEKAVRRIEEAVKMIEGQMQ